MCSTCSSQKHTASGPFTRSWLRGWPLTWRATSTRRSEMSWRFVPFADAETLSSGYFVGSGSPNESNWACFTWRGFTFLSSSPGSSLSWSSSPWPSIWSTLTKWRWGQKALYCLRSSQKLPVWPQCCVPAAAEAPAVPLVLPESRGDSGGDGVRAHLLEEQGDARGDAQRQPSGGSVRQGEACLSVFDELKSSLRLLLQTEINAELVSRLQMAGVSFCDCRQLIPELKWSPSQSSY